jgi:hypothetical protein
MVLLINLFGTIIMKIFTETIAIIASPVMVRLSQRSIPELVQGEPGKVYVSGAFWKSFFWVKYRRLGYLKVVTVKVFRK